MILVTHFLFFVPIGPFSYVLSHMLFDVHSFFLSFRYIRAEVIAGFVNGLFLLFVAFFIFAEQYEVSIYS